MTPQLRDFVEQQNQSSIQRGHSLLVGMFAVLTTLPLLFLFLVGVSLVQIDDPYRIDRVGMMLSVAVFGALFFPMKSGRVWARFVTMIFCYAVVVRIVFQIVSIGPVWLTLIPLVVCLLAYATSGYLLYFSDSILAYEFQKNRERETTEREQSAQQQKELREAKERSLAEHLKSHSG